MILPLVHMNGTSENDLVSSLCNTIELINDAIESLDGCSPNGRDYYLHKDKQALSVAVREFCARRDKLASVRDELVMMIEGIGDRKSEV